MHVRIPTASDTEFLGRSFEVPDEDLPDQDFVAAVLEILLEEQGTVVLHSKLGIRSTGLLLCIYLVAEEGFTATQCMGWMRMVRPGSIAGQQQHALYDLWQTAHEFEQLQILVQLSFSFGSSDFSYCLTPTIYSH